MSNSTSLTLRLLGDNRGLATALDRARTGVRGFARGVRDDVNAIRGAFNTVGGKLAAFGAGISVASQIVASAKLDRDLIGIGQTAGVSKGRVSELRQEIYRLGKQSGRDVEELKDGFNNLIQSGLTWDQALATIRDTNIAMAVTKANADILTGSLSVAANTFDFDLAKPRQALDILDRMTVAGRLGNAELEDLSSVFSRLGPNAKSAGLGFDQTLAFVESLSLIERAPERLATLADSTLRLFTNQRYAQQAQRATKVKFFDENGARRNVADVLADIKAKYSQLGNDLERSKFIQKAFGTVDLDTQKGLKTLLSGNTLDRMNAFTKEIQNASGTLERDMPDAMRDAADQAGRLKNTLRQAADAFARPINSAFSKATKWALDSKQDGGLGLSGGQLLTGGAAATIAAVLLGRRAKGLAGKLLRGTGSLATGVAEGKALEAAAGVTPVFVTNWPDSMGGLPGGLGNGKWQEYLPLPKDGVSKGAPGILGGLGALATNPLTIAAALAVGGFAYASYKSAHPNLLSENDPWASVTKMASASDATSVMPKVQNEINIDVSVDSSGKVIAQSNDRNTKVKVNGARRGALDWLQP